MEVGAIGLLHGCLFNREEERKGGTKPYRVVPLPAEKNSSKSNGSSHPPHLPVRQESRVAHLIAWRQARTFEAPAMYQWTFTGFAQKSA